MFMVFNKDKIKSYLVSLGTVALLFIMCFSITNNDAEIIKTSENVYIPNETKNTENKLSYINNNWKREYTKEWKRLLHKRTKKLTFYVDKLEKLCYNKKWCTKRKIRSTLDNNYLGRKRTWKQII